MPFGDFQGVHEVRHLSEGFWRFGQSSVPNFLMGVIALKRVSVLRKLA